MTSSSSSWLSRILGRGPPAPDLKSRKSRIAGFREILQANNAALGTIGRMQEALEAERPLGAAEVRAWVAAVTVQTSRMVSNLGRMQSRESRGQRELRRRFSDITTRIARRIEVPPALRQVGMVVPLAEVDLIKRQHPRVAVVLLTGHASVELGVQAIELGAFEYLLKPVELDELLDTVRRAAERSHLEER
jgi:DNA-binding NarL/FixJ family response regulator